MKHVSKLAVLAAALALPACSSLGGDENFGSQ
jgi:hypothetical protein